MDTTLKIIGRVHSPLKKIEDCPRQENESAPEAEIEIFPEYTEGIKDIAVGTEMLVFTWLHEADRRVLKCQPRNNAETTFVGVFSTRSPNRPNPIGLHSVKVLAISNSSLIKVSALEVLDQTPVIDIKPLWNTKL